MKAFKLGLTTSVALEIKEDESVLEGLERYGYKMRKSCRNGVCQICTARLREGKVWQRYPNQTFEVPVEGNKPEVLLCTSYLRSDSKMTIDGLIAPGEMCVNQRICDVESIELMNHDVYRVFLRLPATASLAVSYKAGQYLDLVLGDKKASFSIASAPEAGRQLELHIRHMPESDSSNAVIDALKTRSQVTVELPNGDCWLDAEQLASDKTLVFVAASTGFAQMKSMIEHLLAQSPDRDMHLYWGARVAEDLYANALAESWASQYSNVHYTPVIDQAVDTWEGKTGLVTEAVLADFDDMTGLQVFASGSPGMVYAVLDALETKGFKQAQMSADVFAYAPRK